MVNNEGDSGEGMDSRQRVEEQCVQCGLCLKECTFLQRYGDPKTIAQSLAAASASDMEKMAYECNLCGLCTAVCPKDLDFGSMNLELRRRLVQQGRGLVRAHRRILNYERRGNSSRYVHHVIPAGCDTVFFPGCTLAGTRSKQVLKLYEHLRRAMPNLGIILDCCTKPSHDLGRMEHFLKTFGILRETLLRRGVKRVLTACPSCHDIFRSYGGALSVETVYEVLAQRDWSLSHPVSGTVVIHDPCATRFEGSIHAAVRGVVAGMGLTIQEMEHRGRTTLCCGEGGAAGLVAPELAAHWETVRIKESRGLPVITYCAGCVDRLGSTLTMVHVIDLLFEPEASLLGKARVSRAPFTYLRRLRLKNHLRKAALPARMNVS